MVMRGKNDPDVFYGRLLEVLRSRQWEVSVEAEKRDFESGSAETAMTTAAARVRMPVVGVSGILRKEQELWESTDKSLQEAFQDLNALMVLSYSLLLYQHLLLAQQYCSSYFWYI